MKKIAVFHWGLLSIHCYYLVQALLKYDIQVDLYVYTPGYANRTSMQYELLNRMRTITTVVEFHPSSFETSIVKLNQLAKFLRLSIPSLCINPFLPARTRKYFRDDEYKAIITVIQPSLYWLNKTSPKSLHKTIHYSLEAEKLSDPVVLPFTCQAAFIKKEQFLLKKIKMLMIQDVDRAMALVDDALLRRIQTTYLPVSVPGGTIHDESTYLHDVIGIPPEKRIVLYYGSIEDQRKIYEIVAEGEELQTDDIVFVIHGPGSFSHLVKKKEKVYTSNNMVAYDELYKICSSASIGIAFYDQGWPNNKLTVFSSEKIARYLQCGVPFIAFDNENYRKLKTEFDCCELVADISQIGEAINNIMRNYDFYRINAFAAYQKYYRIEHTIQPFVKFIKQI